MLSGLSAKHAGLLLAALGVVSGLLSTFAPINPGGMLEIALFSRSGATLYPAFYFGLALCTGIALWESSSPLRLGVVFVAVMIAWIAAFEAASEIDRYLERFRMTNPPNADGVAVQFPYIMAVAGFIAGIIGSAVTATGVAIVSRDFRSYASVSRTILIGALAGMLLQIDVNWSPGPLLLFVTWQAAVAASVAYGIVEPKRRRLAEPFATPGAVLA